MENKVAASVGSACHSGSETVSGVLAGMGIGFGRATEAVRLSVGVFTTEEEVRYAAKALIRCWREVNASAQEELGR